MIITLTMIASMLVCVAISIIFYLALNYFWTGLGNIFIYSHNKKCNPDETKQKKELNLTKRQFIVSLTLFIYGLILCVVWLLFLTWF